MIKNRRNQKNKQGLNLYKHGFTDTKVYNTWCDMIKRCENSNNKEWRNYGGRGIKICTRWRENFINFLADMGEPPSPKHSIDRIDNDGNYEPENCRWALKEQQMQNRSVSKFIEYQGERKTLAEWSHIFDLDHKVIFYRLKQNWPLDSVFSKADFRPKRSGRPERRPNRSF